MKRVLMMNLLHFVRIELTMMMTVRTVTNVFSYVDRDLFVDRNIYHNAYNEMVVRVYGYFEYAVEDLTKLRNFDCRTCTHTAVLVKQRNTQQLESLWNQKIQFIMSC